jgi:DNA-binding response OmpR family regulator
VGEPRGAAAHGMTGGTLGFEGGKGEAMRYIFSDYVLDTQRLELHHAGAPIKLRRKVFQVLVYLLAHRDRLARPSCGVQRCPGT